MATIGFNVQPSPSLNGILGKGRKIPSQSVADIDLHRHAISTLGLPIPKLVTGHLRAEGNVNWVGPSSYDEDGNKRVNFSAVYYFRDPSKDNTELATIGVVWADGVPVWQSPVVGYQEAVETFLSWGEVENGVPQPATGFFDTPNGAPPMLHRHDGAKLRVYNGWSTQTTPDPLIVADKGVGNVPPWTEFGYVVFENFPANPEGGIPHTAVWVSANSNVSSGGIGTGWTGAPAFLTTTKDRLVGLAGLRQISSVTGSRRHAVGVINLHEGFDREINEWTLRGVPYGVEQSDPIDAVPAPVTYLPSQQLWEAGWPAAFDDQERTYHLELFETANWDEVDRCGPVIGSGNNQGRWCKSATKFRLVQVDSATGARLQTSGFFRSPTEGDEYWWRPADSVDDDVIGAPDHGRAVMDHVQLMCGAKGADGQHIYCLFVSFPEDNDNLHIYWREPQVDTSTPPPFVAPDGPYVDPGEVTHLPGSGRTDIRSSLVVFKTTDLSAPVATVDLGAWGIIPCGICRGPSDGVVVLGTDKAHRRYRNPPSNREAVALLVSGSRVRGRVSSSDVTVTDNSTYTEVFEPDEDVATGTMTAGSGEANSFEFSTIDPPAPIVVNPGDVLIWHGMIRDDDFSGTFSTPEGYTPFPGNPYGTRTATPYTPRVFLFWKIADGTEAGTSQPADYTLHSTTPGESAVFARVYRFKATAGFEASPVEAISVTEGVTSAGDTAIDCPTVAPSGSSRLGVICSSINDDEGDTDSATGETGGDWTQGVPESVDTFPADAILDVQIAQLPDGQTISGGAIPYGAEDDEWVAVGFALAMTSVDGRNATEKPWPMSGFYDSGTGALYLFANRRPMHPDDYQSAFPRKLQYTGTVYKVAWPSGELLGTLDRVPPEQYTQLLIGPKDGKIRLQGDFDDWEETAEDVYEFVSPFDSAFDIQPVVTLADMSSEIPETWHRPLQEDDPLQIFRNRRVEQGQSFLQNDLYFDERREAFVMLG